MDLLLIKLCTVKIKNDHLILERMFIIKTIWKKMKAIIIKPNNNL
jgi:hypothetical protein